MLLDRRRPQKVMNGVMSAGGALHQLFDYFHCYVRLTFKQIAAYPLDFLRLFRSPLRTVFQ